MYLDIRHRRQTEIAVVRKNVASHIARRLAMIVYSDHADLVMDLPQMERSAYYPYGLSFDRLYGIDLIMKNRIDPGGRQVTYRSQYDTVIGRRTEIATSPADPKRDTAKLLRFFASGVAQQKSVINEIREDFVYSSADFALAISKSGATVRLLPPAPFAGDLPKNNMELKSYVLWLDRIEGMSQLSDGWGRPIRISLRSGRLISRSSGPDGVFNTPDDIVVSSRIVKQ